MSNIEWTEKTWNPIVGCSIVSPGCTNCYAMKMASRLDAMAGDGLDDNGYAVRGESALGHYRGTTRKVKGNAVWTGKLALAPERTLLEPLRRKKPTMYFVNSMGDLFHEDVPDEWIDRVFAVMALCPQHTFQVLTKRSARMRAYCERPRWRMWADAFSAGSLPVSLDEIERRFGLAQRMPRDTAATWPLPNVWLGVSAEDQKRADERIPDLLATPAAVRFVSAEPLLGPISFMLEPDADTYVSALTGSIKHLGENFQESTARLDWIIVGGESGNDARPMHPDWARGIRDQCAFIGVPFFFKQWGEWLSAHEALPNNANDMPYGEWHGEGEPFTRSCICGVGHGTVIRVGKRAAGRLLDGREHNDMPPGASVKTCEAA